MRTLPNDWLVDGHIDFEYKKYTLLAYLQAVQSNFSQKKLYPDLSDLKNHYEKTLDFRHQKEKLNSQLGRRLLGVDWQQMSLVFDNEIEPDPLLHEIEEIVSFSLPKLRLALNSGQHLADEVEQSIQISPVGIVPLHTHEGYLFVYQQVVKEADVYYYQIRLFDNGIPPERQMFTSYLTTVRKGIGTTFENLKLQLVKSRKDLPNPASYVVECKTPFPLHETLLPIAKRKAVKYILS